MDTIKHIIKSRFGLFLLLVVIFQAFLLLVILKQSSKGILGGDGPYYHESAINLIEYGKYGFFFEGSQKVESMIGRAPGYTFFVALVYSLFGNSILMLRIMQFFLVWMTAYGLYKLAKYYVEENTARLSGFLCATYIPIVFLALWHLTEVVTTTLLVWLIYTIKSWSEKQNPVNAVFSGLFFGLLVLIRPNWALIVFPLTIVVLIPILKTNRKNIYQFILFGVFSSLIVGSWVYRNYTISGIPTIGLTAGQSLYASALQYSGKAGNNFSMEDWNFWSERGKELSDKAKNMVDSNSQIPQHIQLEILSEKVYQDEAKQEWKELTFSQIITALPKRMYNFWDLFLMTPEVGRLSVTVFSKVYFLLLAALTIVGFYLRRKFLLKDFLLVLPAVYISLIHCIFHVEARYGLPARVFLLIYSSVGIYFLVKKFSNKFFHTSI